MSAQFFGAQILLIFPPTTQRVKVEPKLSEEGTL